jgi:hypothetical protein
MPKEKQSKYKELLNELDIDEKFTKPPQKQKVFNKVKDNVTPIEHYNYMADLLELPTTKKGFKYCFVIVDLATNAFDIEPIKNKDSQTTLNALKSIFKRKIITKPEMSLTTDGGSEFKSVFHRWLESEDINHKIARPYRHKQLANVESLNKQLARLFNGYMNSKEHKTKKVFKEWDEAIPVIRRELNKIRKRELPEDIFEIPPPNINLEATPKFKVGDIVYLKLETPEDALGNKQNTNNFRVGDYRFDTTPKEIVKVLIFPKTPTFRYMLRDINNASFTENELILAEDEEEARFEIKKVIGKKKVKNKIYYLIWWKGYSKEQATWESRKKLLDDGIGNLIREYGDKN